MSSLLVIIPDRPSMLVAKGEYTPRYYNPGNLFDKVHILMTNDDRPDPKAMQKTVGDAKLYLHNLPIPFRLFFYSVGFPSWFLRRWAEPAVRLSREVRPSLIRCHGNYLNAYIAGRIKQTLRIPHVISLHTNPDEDIRGKQIGWKGHILNWAMQGVEQTALNQADIVLPVYKSILPYTKRLGAKNVEVVSTKRVPVKRKKTGKLDISTPAISPTPLLKTSLPS